MRRSILFLVIFIFSGLQLLKSQDFYFSQFYASPLTLNPALTGLIPGDFRVATNYRNQNSYLLPFSTYSASFDMKLFRTALDKDVFGLGMVVVKDDLSGGSMSNTMLMLSAAYHKSLGKSGNDFVSLGFQGGIFQRNVDPYAFSYQEQWVPGVGYDPNVAITENFLNTKTLIVDMQGGLFWYHFLSDNSSIFAGASAFHITEPTETLFDEPAHFSRRIVAHGGARLPITDEIYIMPNVVSVFQSNAKDMIVGTTGEYWMDKTAVKLGGWYRMGDSFIISAGFEFSSIQIGISYDFVSSELSYSESKGGFELSLVYSSMLKNIVNLRANPGKSF